jgi:hypothetical protein
MELLLYILAGVGLLMIFIGRHIMIRDTGGDLPFLWIIALRLIPFSELLYMVRHYAQARTGGIVSIIGMWLMVPLLGVRMWESEKVMEERMAEFEVEMAKIDASEEATAAMLSEVSAESAAAFYQEQEQRLAGQAKKIAQMNARLKWWFDSLQEKRGKLTGDPRELEKFNTDVAAYGAYNELAKEVNSEYAALQKIVAKRR